MRACLGGSLGSNAAAGVLCWVGWNYAKDTGTIRYNTRTSHVRSSGETKVAHG